MMFEFLFYKRLVLVCFFLVITLVNVLKSKYIKR